MTVLKVPLLPYFRSFILPQCLPARRILEIKFEHRRGRKMDCAPTMNICTLTLYDINPEYKGTPVGRKTIKT
jgi:hypothetical protein